LHFRLKAAGFSGEELRKEREQIMTSFIGPIYGMEGKTGDVVYVTSAKDKRASGIYVTLKSQGASSNERVERLALPDANTAEIEEKATLTRPQQLLVGEVAPQGQKYMKKNDWVKRPQPGGGQQVVTEGGIFSKAVRFAP
jgi:hypothetical protein